MRKRESEKWGAGGDQVRVRVRFLLKKGGKVEMGEKGREKEVGDGTQKLIFIKTSSFSSRWLHGSI